MKARLLLPIALVALSLVSAFSQAQPGQPIPVLPQGYPSGVPSRALSQPEPPKFKPFSLDFPGGTPRQLVAALEKAMGRPLNFVIPAEEPDIKFPPFKVNNVSLWNLSEALGLVSSKTESYVTSTLYGGAYGGGGAPLSNYRQMNTSYGFRSQGPPSDDAIWYFYVEKPNMPPVVSPVVQKVCRYYPLTTYLERGLTVDDITTAIQTGWKMLGNQETPTISFHKETKLLIAVGDPAKLETIDAVLKALSPIPETFSDRMNAQIRDAAKKSAAGGSLAAPAKPAEQPKTEN